MKDIPMFVTDSGVASIILKEIPYRNLAYIRVRDVQPGGLEDLIAECAAFCRAAGAERILATGHEGLKAWPHECDVYSMSGPSDCSPQALLWPVTPENVARWRGIYNEKMRSVDNAATLTAYDEKQLTAQSGACFVHDGQRLLGIGWIDGDKLLCVASVVPGMGRQVLDTLLSRMEGDRAWLEVASTNHRAIRLYEAAGFVKTGLLSDWYRIM